MKKLMGRRAKGAIETSKTEGRFIKECEKETKEILKRIKRKSSDMKVYDAAEYEIFMLVSRYYSVLEQLERYKKQERIDKQCIGTIVEGLNKFGELKIVSTLDKWEKLNEKGEE